MPFSTIFIDLDDTLYPADSGVWQAIRERIDLYVAQRFGLSIAEARLRGHDLFQRYGTTMRGLQAEYHVDEDEYLAFVHDVPLANYIQPNPALRDVLDGYEQQKIVFTNADVNHARRVIRVLDLEGCFDGVVDIKRMTPYCKPMAEAFQIALRESGESDPARCVLVDDHLQNVKAALSLGMNAVRIGAPDPEARLAIPRIGELPRVLSAEGFISG
jgi:putative hydrolase of the HAD superfamily